jgi:hypothetical protein
MRSPQKTVVQVTAWLALLIFSPQIAQAQELRPFAITDYGGEASFEVLYQTEVAESETRDQEFEELTMKETVGVWSKGYIYHPDLLEFDAGFDLGLSQERETGEVEEDRSSDLIGYDVHLAIEQNQPYGVELFALKNQRIVEQKFAPNSIVDLTQYRLIWSTDNRFLPTTVHLSSSTTEQTGTFDRTEEDRRITISSRNNLGGFSRTNMRYQFRDFNQEEFDFKTQSHDLNVSNTLFFDDSKTKRLNSNVLYRTQKNGVTNDQISGLTRFSWQHTRDFQSFYGLRLSNTSVSSTGAETVDTFTHDEEVGFRHQLYENLTTVASLGWTSAIHAPSRLAPWAPISATPSNGPTSRPRPA